MPFLKFRPFTGPQVHEFKDPDTGFHYRGKDALSLHKQIIQYRANNDLEPLEALPAVVENYLCLQPVNAGRCQENTELKRNLWQSFKGGVVLLHNMLYKKFASQTQADARAQICITCPKNVFPENKSVYIATADKIAEASTLGRKSKYHNELGNCIVCSCPLRCKVFYGEKITLTPEEKSEMPDFCWQLKESNG